MMKNILYILGRTRRHDFSIHRDGKPNPYSISTAWKNYSSSLKWCFPKQQINISACEPAKTEVNNKRQTFDLK